MAHYGIQVAAPALDAAMVEMRLHLLGVGPTILARACILASHARGAPRGCSSAKVSRGRNP